MSDMPLDYYATLSISSGASQNEIRTAYKKAALECHPDRVPADSPERPTRTRKFQQVNDAYYTLCDPTRRCEYDAARTAAGSSRAAHDFDEEEVPRPEAAQGGFASGFPWSAFGFGAKTEGEKDEFSNQQFGTVFEEMLRDEGMAEGDEARPNNKFWSLVGTVSGGALGFIMANAPGAIAGAVAGNRLGSVRDARGKSVYAVFQELDQPAKMKLLGELAQKMFAHAIS